MGFGLKIFSAMFAVVGGALLYTHGVTYWDFPKWFVPATQADANFALMRDFGIALVLLPIAAFLIHKINQPAPVKEEEEKKETADE